MDDRHQRNIEHFQQATGAIGRDAVERARVPGTDEHVYCRCYEGACGSEWTGPASAWSCGFGFSSDEEEFMVRLCAEHDTVERRTEIEARLRDDLAWLADIWSRLWVSLLNRESKT